MLPAHHIILIPQQQNTCTPTQYCKKKRQTLVGDNFVLVTLLLFFLRYCNCCFFYRRCCCFRRGNWCKQWRGMLLLLEWIKHPLLRWQPQEKKSNQLRKCHLGEAFYHFKSTMIFISSAMFSLAALEKKSNQLCKCHPWTHLRSLYRESRMFLIPWQHSIAAAFTI